MIDPAAQLATLIRTQFAAQFRTRRRGSSVEPGPRDTQGAHGEVRSAADDTPSAAAPGQEDAQIRQLVALRIRALSPDDPHRHRKAFRLFLESVLMLEFGRDRLDSCGFDQMVDAVLQRMETDDGLHAALLEAGDLLLTEVHSSVIDGSEKTSPPHR